MKKFTHIQTHERSYIGTVVSCVSGFEINFFVTLGASWRLTEKFWSPVRYFRLSLLNATAMPFAADKRHAWHRPLHQHIACNSLWPGEKAAETIWRAVNIVLMCRNTIFFSSLVIFRYYFAGNRKVSCILATISDWFPNKKI